MGVLMHAQTGSLSMQFVFKNLCHFTWSSFTDMVTGKLAFKHGSYSWPFALLQFESLSLKLDALPQITNNMNIVHLDDCTWINLNNVTTALQKHKNQ